MESTDSSSGGGSQQELHAQLPPGFRFHPTDEELVVHYLRKKASSAPLPVAIIADVDLYKFDPWELPGKASFGEEEWYFFSPRDRKYPNGARPNRAATSGYWKATGTDKPIVASGGTQKVGVKKALVFYGGKPPKGVKTNWIMHEYRLSDGGASSSKSTPPGVDAASASKTNNKSSLRLDDWVLCRIYQKNSSGSQRLLSEEGQEKDGDAEDMYYKSLPLPLLRHHVAVPRRPTSRVLLHPHDKPDYTTNYDALHLDNDENFFEGLLAVGSIQVNHPLPHLALHRPSKPDCSMLPGSVGSLPLKRSLSSAIWNEAGAIMGSPGKRVQSCSCDVSGVNNDRETHLTNEDDNNNNGCGGGGDEGSPSMMATLLNHLQQQGAPYHHHHSPMLSAIGEGAFRQPYQLHGINWG